MSDSQVFVTGFGPFGRVEDNPSGRLAETCGRDFRVLEVSYHAVDEFLRELDESSFDVLLMLGVAENRSHVELELFGRNHRSNRPDVRGVTPTEPIEPAKELLLQSSLWTPDLVAKIVISDHVGTSIDAGDYLCNYILYEALTRFPQKRVGFVHVPSFEKISEPIQQTVLADILRWIDEDLSSRQS